MNNANYQRFILHVSDFHLRDNKKDLKNAREALKCLTDTLKKKEIKVDYLLHTGDVIDSSDVYLKIARTNSEWKKYIKKKNNVDCFDSTEFQKKASKKQRTAFDKKLIEVTQKRFEEAGKLLSEFITDLNLSFGSVVICSGNHDIPRLMELKRTVISCCKSGDEEWKYDYNDKLKIFNPFNEFLDNLNVANSPRRIQDSCFCKLDSLNILLINTNWPNPKDQKEGNYCINCKEILSAIEELDKDNLNDNKNRIKKPRMNILMAHKPFYEICERVRLSNKRYVSTPFMSSINKYVGSTGIYLCGDKHTRSISGTEIMDIPHYMGGEPLKLAPKTLKNEVEYNLLEISGSDVGLERKIHLSYNNAEWSCNIRPQDKVVSSLYELSKIFLLDNDYLMLRDTNLLDSWEKLCQDLYSLSKSEAKKIFDYLNKSLYSICKFRENGKRFIPIQEDTVGSVARIIIDQIENNQNDKNILNIRGEHGSGKSTYMTLLYVLLLFKYSKGEIDFIPAYFNLESQRVMEKIQEGESYYDAVNGVFEEFACDIQHIADKERQEICFLIDGLDEQDCWSYSTEDSVGRGILNILDEHQDSWYIMCFSQQRLPCFKNTMPSRKYDDLSHILYFNPIDVKERDDDDDRFELFVESYLDLHSQFRTDDDCEKHIKSDAESSNRETDENNNNKAKTVCEIVKRFRRLTINPDFLCQHIKFIERYSSVDTDLNVTETYNYYIDKQHALCMEKLGYGFINYAPAMAYLFAYKGYTFQQFKRIRDNNEIERHI